MWGWLCGMVVLVCGTWGSGCYCIMYAQFNCSAQCSRALRIKIAKCCAKGINMIWLNMAQCRLNKTLIWLSAVHQAYYGLISLHQASIIIWLNAVHPCLNAIRHQYVAQCCASGINMAVHHALIWLNVVHHAYTYNYGSICLNDLHHASSCQPCSETAPDKGWSLTMWGGTYVQTWLNSSLKFKISELSSTPSLQWAYNKRWKMEVGIFCMWW